jgi:uncharacterized MAPEG superfamily protein
MMNCLDEFFRDVHGKRSHKRLIGAGAFIVSSLVVAIEAMKDTPFDSALMWAYTGLVGSVAMGNAAEVAFKKKDIDVIDPK